MEVLKRLFVLMKPYWKLITLGILFSFLTIGSNMGLLITSAYLISWAALSPQVMELMTLVAGVRFFGVSRGVFRYGERYLTHQAAFNILGRIRVQLYQSLENLPPGQLTTLHSGQLLNRLMGDIESLKEVYLRVFLPPLVALLILLGTSFFLALPSFWDFFIGPCCLITLYFTFWPLLEWLI